MLHEKLVQRHASSPRMTLRSLFRRSGGRADAINYQQFRRLLESLGVHVSEQDFASLVTGYGPANDGMIDYEVLASSVGLPAATA